MKLLKKSVLLTILFSSPLFASNVPINQIIIGGSYKPVPVVLTSTDSKIWNLPTIANLPENAHTTLSAVNCNDARSCIIVGGYSILPEPASGHEGGTLFLNSKDGGLHWSFKKGHSARSGILNAISCQDEQFCVAAGFGGSFVAGWHPSVMQTVNGGNTWTDVKNVPGTGGDTGNKAKASACNSKACVVIGEYHNSFEAFHPLLFTTNDKGKHWTQNEIVNLPKIEHMIGVNLTKVNCNEKMCLATGGYLVAAADPKDLPVAHEMLVVGNATATKWSRVDNVDLTDLSLRTSHCDENGCLILGENKRELAALYTTDNGQTWESLKNFYNLPKYDWAFLTAISCLDNHCVAVGEYIKDKLSYPLIGRSEDDGRSWEFKNEIDSRITPSTYTGLGTVNCTEQSCVATGIDSNGVFMLYSHDRGLNWSDSTAFPDLINENLYFTGQASSKASLNS